MKKLKVIVIDDEMLIRKLIRMKMDTKRLNLEVAGEYANGAAALQELREIRPDIVISDICMPEADGLLFSEECVKLFPEIKIILVTGYDDFEYARRGIKAGVFDYLLKPIQEEELNVSASKEGVVHNRSFFVILTTDSFEALFISYFKPAGIR